MRLTARGRGMLVLATTAWSGALVTGHLPLACLALVLSVLLSVSLATLGSPGVAGEHRFARSRYAEGERATTTVQIELRRGRRKFARLDLKCPPGIALRTDDAHRELELRRAHPTTLELEWDVVTWGRKRFPPLTLVFTDFLGVLEHRAEVGEACEVLVRPATQPVGKHNAKASNPERALGQYNVSRPGDGSEFFALRPYQSGDSIRKINWRASARSKETMVNQATRESYARVTVIVDLRAKEGLGGEPTAATRNGRAAAAILNHHDRAKDSLNLVVLGGGVDRPRGRRNPRMGDLLDFLVLHEPGGSMRTDEAAQALIHEVRPKSPVYVITSAALDPDLAAAVNMLRSLRANVIVISPSPEAEEFGPDAALVQATRRRTLQDLRSLGVRCHDWAPAQPLQVALLE